MADEWTISRVRVIYGDTDAMGVVYYGNYMRYLEQARGELMRGLGKPYGEVEARGLAIPVAEVGVRYLAPARYDDELLVKIKVAKLTGATVRFEYEVVRASDETLLATGFTRHAVIDVAKGCVVRIPADLAAVLSPAAGE
ncbi:MAG: acyl-CoA thioesterase [Planctomycetota bacterium]